MSICILRGCLSEFLLDDASLSLRIAFTLANSAVPYEVLPYGNVILYDISSGSSLFAEVPVGPCLLVSRLKRVWLFVGPTGVYLLDFFCSGIQFNLLLSPYPCFIFLLYLDLYVLGDDALIS